MQTPKVSLIVPLHKASRYIAPCLVGLLEQTLEEIEVLFVDDCDPEASLETVHKMLEGYAGGKQFRFLRTEVNGGPGIARNLGLSQARGEYVAFVDCDDALEPDYCSRLYAAACAHGADLVCCDAYIGEYGNPAGGILQSPSFVPGEISAATRRRILRTFVTYLWTYLFRREFLQVNGIVFPPEHSSEDSCFVTCAWLTATRAVHIDEPLYHYIIRRTSVSKRRDRSRARSRVASMRCVKAFASERNLLRPYGPQIRWILLKKGYMSALLDLLRNL